MVRVGHLKRQSSILNVTKL